MGRPCAVRFRAWKQRCLYRLGTSIHRKTHVFFLPLLLALGVLLAGFKAFDKNTEFNQLWIECKSFTLCMRMSSSCVLTYLCQRILNMFEGLQILFVYSGRSPGNGIALLGIDAGRNRKHRPFVGHANS